MWRRSLNIFFSLNIFTVAPERHWICVLYVESSSLHSNNDYVDFAVKNPRKLKEKPHKIGLDRMRLLPLSRKIQARTHPLLCFFAAEIPWFNLGAYWIVKPLKCVFYYLKGRGPLKKVKNLRKCREYMAHRLIPLTPPFFFHFTLPLSTKMINFTFLNPYQVDI